VDGWGQTCLLVLPCGISIVVYREGKVRCCFRFYPSESIRNRSLMNVGLVGTAPRIQIDASSGTSVALPRTSTSQVEEERKRANTLIIATSQFLLVVGRQRHHRRYCRHRYCRHICQSSCRAFLSSVLVDPERCVRTRLQLSTSCP